MEDKSSDIGTGSVRDEQSPAGSFSGETDTPRIEDMNVAQLREVVGHVRQNNPAGYQRLVEIAHSSGLEDFLSSSKSAESRKAS